MSAVEAPWTARIFQQIELLGPQPLEVLIAEVRNLVPPGRAYRKAANKRDQQRLHRTNKTDRKQPRRTSEDETIRSGQRQIVMDSITKLVARGRLEYADHDGVRYVHLGREALPNGMASSELVRKLNEHQPTYSKRRLEGLKGFTGRPIDVVDIECSCGWTWSGSEADVLGIQHVYATSKDQAEKEFTKHRRSFV